MTCLSLPRSVGVGLLLLLLNPAVSLLAQTNAASVLVPFVLPWDDATAAVPNVSAWLDKPAGSRGFVVARDGHLYAGVKRIRFLGVNVCFGAGFPKHEDAEKITARMAKFGINCVRFHHMDNQPAPQGIFANRPQGDPFRLRTLDPGQLDRLDYFIAQLKKNGIYADLNLHVSRLYPGLPAWDNMPYAGKGVDNFHPRLIELQREYARDLLTHQNPYTGARYSDEPAVAFLEINNENGLLDEWWNGHLEAMPEEWAGELARQWNAWLNIKYPNTAALQRAWADHDEPLGAELLTNGHWTDGANGWVLEQHDRARATVTVTDAVLRLDVTETGMEGWHIQFHQPGLLVERSRLLTVAFRAKADPARLVSIGLSQTHDPWRVLAGNDLRLTPQWQTFNLPLVPTATDGQARLIFSNLARQTGSVWLADVSLRTGGTAGLRADETRGGVGLFHRAAFASRSIAAQRDWIRFLWDTEKRYWLDMNRFLKQDLAARALVIGSAIGFSPQPIQAELDVVDAHAYWQHPHFPGRPWDSDNWTVANISMTAATDGGTLPGLIARRVPGKPYICTEYNHSAPNTFSSEAFLMLAATAAREDWDGVFAFAYSHRHDDWDTRRITSFFDIDQHPAKMATLPAAAALFCRADVTATPSPVIPVTESDALERLRIGGSWEALPAPRSWNATNGVFIVNAGRSKAVVGFVRGRVFDLGGVRIAPGATRQDWMAITVTEMVPGCWLVTATGYTENTAMGWKNPQKTTVGRDWGEAPSLVEVIPAAITFPAAVRAWALDERGQRQRQLPDGGAVVEIGPRWQTVWYEVRTRSASLPDK